MTVFDEKGALLQLCIKYVEGDIIPTWKYWKRGNRVDTKSPYLLVEAKNYSNITLCLF